MQDQTRLWKRPQLRTEPHPSPRHRAGIPTLVELDDVHANTPMGITRGGPLELRISDTTFDAFPSKTMNT